MPKAPPALKPVTFLGSSRDDLRDMPEAVRHAIGVELMTVQLGGTPTDFKPMPSVGAGAYEIRVRDAAGAFRTVYVTKFAEAIYVLHAFQKKTQKTTKADLELAQRCYKLIPGGSHEEDRFPQAPPQGRRAPYRYARDFRQRQHLRGPGLR